MPPNPGAEALTPDARATPAKVEALMHADDWRNGGGGPEQGRTPHRTPPQPIHPDPDPQSS